jgi:hypothetical protein
MDQDYFRSQLHYDSETGEFKRIATSGNRSKIGEVLGFFDKQGYVIVKIKGRCYKAHRLAFLYMTGSFPCGDVDHINCVKSDNRWANLRIVDRSANMCNRGITSKNKSGFKGVSWCKKSKKWHAQIAVNRKKFNLGYYENIDMAAFAYRHAGNALHGDFFRDMNE